MDYKHIFTCVEIGMTCNHTFYYAKDVSNVFSGPGLSSSLLSWRNPSQRRLENKLNYIS